MSTNQEKLNYVYLAIRELEKKMPVLMSQVQQQYRNSLNAIERSIEEKIHDLKQYQEQIVQRMKGIRDDGLKYMEQQWQKFQIYAQETRKIYLGGAKTSQLPKFNLDLIRQKCSYLETTKEKLNQIVNQAQRCLQQDFSLAKKNQNISCMPVSRQLYKISDKSIPNRQISKISFDISPIKKKFDTQSNQPQKDFNISGLKSALAIDPPKTKENNFDDVKSRISPNLKYQTKSKIQSPICIKQLKSNRVDPPNHVKREDLPNHQITDKLTARMTQKSIIGEFKSPRKEVQTLTKVKSERKFEKGYQNCLQALHQQKLTYDRLKSGLK